MKFATHFLPLLTAAKLFAANDPFAEGVRTTDPLTPEAQQKTFKLPPGFTVQLVAAEPQLRKPMNMAFDGAGRLWFTESREYPWPTNAAPRDTIRILSDFDANGRAHKVTTFATNLNIPIGLYPFLSPRSSRGNEAPIEKGKDQSLLTSAATNLTWKCIAWSIPNIWLFEDTDGDGVADKQTKLLGPFDHLRDTHGNQASFRRGNDGWIYATHGFNNRSKVAGADGHEVFLPSGNIYRFRMDGSRIEHWTHGQVNPFGLTFDAMGNLYSADCHSSPIYQLLRGGYYPSFGAPDDGLGFAPTTIQHSHGSTAICGITVLDDPSWPEEFKDNLIIGNVMTSRINRDRVEWRGSSSVGHEMPDFVSVTDPWFRPVDLQLGPDGALWVSDFYNRIIGHYEVPLTHPLRDRERGRIWRIVPPAQRAASVPLATSLTLPTTLAGLVTELGSSNRTRRALAQHRLVDTFGTNAVPMLLDTAKGVYQFPTPAQNAHARVHASWALLYLNAFDDRTLGTMLDQRTPELRVHAARMLAELGLRSAGQIAGAKPVHSMDNTRVLLFSLLEDSETIVRRAAADALGVFPAQANVGPLLQVLEKTPAADTHLRHVIRMALRDSLSTPGQLDNFTASEKSSRAVAEVTLAITNSRAAAFLVAHLQKYSEPREVAAKYLKHAARFLPEDRIDDLATLARDKFRDDVDLQAALFKSVQEGLAQRGVALSPRMKLWGNALADDLLSSVRRTESEWISLPVDSNPSSANPWAVQRRKSGDGKDADFLCTLPAGETLTGVLRSRNFTAPAKLTFWMAGHDGQPPQPLQKKNFVRLRDAESFDVLVTAPAPRNDIARATTWELSAHAGKQVFLELVDGDTAGAYAWLAVGRFEPAVVTLPKTTPKLIDERLISAAQIALATRDPALEAPLAAALKTPAGVDARAAVATTLLAMNSKQYLPACSEIMNDAGAPDALRQRIAQSVVEANSAEGRALVVETLRRLPERAQPKFALALATAKPGAEILLQEVESGRVSARLLQNQGLKEKIVAAKPDKASARMAKLTANLTPLNEQIQKVIDQRAKAFGSVKGFATTGAAVFEKNCAACHQLDNKGALVGPQLDGLGARGAERIMEDILDPNRNVDGAFRATLFELNDGDVVSGLWRREEGELVIYAEATGKELSVPKKNIKSRRPSDLSLMPDNFADTIPANEFNDLITFLLTKTATKK